MSFVVCLGFFPQFFFPQSHTIHPYTNTTWVSASEVVHSTVDILFLTNKKTSAQEAWTLAQWQLYAESPSGVWKVVNENTKHISAYNVQRLDLHKCTRFATCTARDENEIKTSWEWLSWEDTISIKKNLNIKYKYRSHRTLLIILKDRNTLLLLKEVSSIIPDPISILLTGENAQRLGREVHTKVYF